MPRPKLLNSEKIAGPNDQVVTVRFYDDRSLRFQVNGVRNMALTEAFLRAGKDDFVILKLIPIED